VEVYKMHINGSEMLKSSYSVYVIVLNNNNNKFFYVGQTGDRHSISARPPLLRLMGHLEKQKTSTQNQIYRGIVEKILNIQYDSDVYEKVEEYLKSATLEMYIFPIYEFDYAIKKADHSKYVKNVETIENQVINIFVGKYGSPKLLNKKIVANTTQISNRATEIAEYVFKLES